jgi:ADP-ribosyl-[dinitrogen reductase] hydrolase
MSPEAIRKEYGVLRDIVGGGWLELEPGAITDDTEMMMCVARSLVEQRGTNFEDMANKLADWYDSNPVDIGSTCRAGIHRYIKRKLNGEGGLAYLGSYPSEDQAGNGALLRVLPFALFYWRSRMQIFKYMQPHCHLTHNNDLSDGACRIYLNLIYAAIRGRMNRDGLKEEFNDFCSGGHQFFWHPINYPGKAGGYVLETMQTVLHCFFTTENFEDALIKCVNLGGDADSNAALLGGLAGVCYGLERIPQRWLDALDPLVFEECQALACKLWLASCGPYTDPDLKAMVENECKQHKESL